MVSNDYDYLEDRKFLVTETEYEEALKSNFNTGLGIGWVSAFILWGLAKLCGIG